MDILSTYVPVALLLGGILVAALAIFLKDRNTADGTQAETESFSSTEEAQSVKHTEEYVTGKVKWFSKEKGYGFITDSKGQDYYFHVKNVKGSELPMDGAGVEFIARTGHKGLAASEVSITEQGKKQYRGFMDVPDNELADKYLRVHVIARLKWALFIIPIMFLIMLLDGSFRRFFLH
jgi:cold shock CspA family protein